MTKSELQKRTNVATHVNSQNDMYNGFCEIAKKRLAERMDLLIKDNRYDLINDLIKDLVELKANHFAVMAYSDIHNTMYINR